MGLVQVAPWPNTFTIVKQNQNQSEQIIIKNLNIVVGVEWFHISLYPNIQTLVTIKIENYFMEELYLTKALRY